MRLKEIIYADKDRVIEKWHKLIMESYPEESRKLYGASNMQFSNPVGYQINESLFAIFECIFFSDNKLIAEKALSEIIRIRAIQSIGPAEALAFLPGLKNIIYGYVSGKKDLFDEYFLICNEIDKLTLDAFDLYTADREKLYSLRDEEIKKSAYVLIEKVNKKYYRESQDKI
jgi:hypothetical protein